MKDNTIETQKGGMLSPLYYIYSKSENTQEINNLSFQQQISNKHISTIDTDNSIKNSIENSKSSKSLIPQIDKSVDELYKIYGKDNCLSNFLLFEENINFFAKYEKFNKLKDITLNEYLESFITTGNFGLNIPFLSENYSITHNVFYPTLSSMILLIKSKKCYENKLMNSSISISYLNKNIKKIEFNEKNPYYHRDTIDSKLKEIHKVIGKKKIKLNDIINKGSYFSILWTPNDTNNIKSSFLSFYTFDLQYIGSLIIKNDEEMWLSCISLTNNFIDFKTDYLNKLKTISNFINAIYNNNTNEIFFSNDYRRYIYNQNK